MSQPLHLIRPLTTRSFPDLAEVWRFRDLCIALGRRDVTLRYRQTLLGVIWVVLQPLIAGGLFTIVFGKVAKLPSEGRPYFLFAFAGFVAWSAFQSTLGRASGSLVGQSNLITKVYFPRLVLPISALFSSVVDFLVGLGSLAVLLVAYGATPGLPLLTLPFWILLLHAMGLGLGTLAAALSVRFRDLQHALPVLVQLLLYASPVAYAVSAVPERLRPFFFLNPMSGVLDGFRWAVLGTTPPSAMGVAFAVAGAIVALIVGAVVFARFERQLADVI
ncbi:MAG TPA: ABC transporter permease [Gemmatimonadaceae bacterium]|nr:ABC transporter permease [Gemmatimonadaceae bacterium]